MSTIAKTNIPVTVDLSDPTKIAGSNFTVVQGSNNAKIKVKFTRDGEDLTADTYDIEVWLVTSDSLDFRCSVLAAKQDEDFSYNSSSSLYELTYDNCPVIFQTKGHCQLIFYINGYSCLPLDYFVIDNPTYGLEFPTD